MDKLLLYFPSSEQHLPSSIMYQTEWTWPRNSVPFIALVFLFLNANLHSFYRSHETLSQEVTVKWPHEVEPTNNSTLKFEGTQKLKQQSAPTGIPTARIAADFPEENSASWVHVAVVSDRDTKNPFLALVHSILMYTTAPVAFHVFTEHPYVFLNGIEKKTPYARVFYYSNAPNNERAARLVDESNFITIHHSGITSMSRLFIGQSPFQPIGKVPKVIIVDDDILFYRDISELWKIVMVNQSNISLFCHPDKRRMRRWLRRHKDNGDREGGRYCQGGLMALPVAAFPGAVNSSKYFWDATFDMTAQYPNVTYHLAHQQILNRMFVKHKSTIDIIPCNWHGDTHTCRVPRKCNCEGESFTYHFLKKAYEKKPHMFSKERPRWAFSYYTNRTLDSVLVGLNERITKNNGWDV